MASVWLSKVLILENFKFSIFGIDFGSRLNYPLVALPTFFADEEKNEVTVKHPNFIQHVIKSIRLTRKLLFFCK
jgi:hypothetical protein